MQSLWESHTLFLLFLLFNYREFENKDQECWFAFSPKSHNMQKRKTGLCFQLIWCTWYGPYQNERKVKLKRTEINKKPTLSYGEIPIRLFESWTISVHGQRADSRWLGSSQKAQLSKDSWLKCSQILPLFINTEDSVVAK